MSGYTEFTTPQFQAKFTELQTLLAEAYEHSLVRDSHHKSSEGAISLHFPEFYWSFNSDRRIRVEIFSYCFGSQRTHHFDNIDEALRQVHKWHRTEMTEQ